MQFKHQILSVFTVLFFSLAVFAQEQANKFPLPEVKILGAEQPIPVGKMVILSASPLKEKPANLVSANFSWLIINDDGQEENFIPWPDGTRIFFGAGMEKKKMLALLEVTFFFVVKEGDKIVDSGVRSTGIIATPIIVGESPGPKPPPNPNPNPPTPDPEPVFPDGQFHLSKLAWQWANEKVSANARGNGAKAIVQAMQSIVSAISAGAIARPADVLEKTHAANNAALKNAGIDPAAWDAWGSELQKNLLQLYKDKKLNTVADYKAAWLEIISGLDKVK
jgi:hypothetical protein